MSSAPNPSTILLDAPAKDYAEALAQFAVLQARDGDDVNPLCRSQLLTHGQRAARAIVLIHGMTNCPHQFVQLAPLLYERGFNVLMPRMPHNGLLDRNTTALSKTTAGELAHYGTQASNIACGLGERVFVAGISAGGNIAGWAAQFLPVVDSAILIAPSFGIVPPLRLGNATANWLAGGLLRLLPNIMTQRLRPFTEGPPHGYLGFSSKGLGAMLLLGDEVKRGARATKPAARQIVLILNAADPAVNNPMTLSIARHWEQHGGNVTIYTFSADRKLIHDIIDPQQPRQQVAEVYPILLDLIDKLG
jgi:hypothetical protein